MPRVALFLLGWLIGSVPTAYVLVRRSHGLDLRREGSSNIGAMNTYEVTGSRRAGLAVMVLDAGKGALAVFLALRLGAEPGVWSASAGLLGAIVGHNFNPWLSCSAGRLEGGKGLATAAGGLLFFMPLLVPVWLVLFLAGWWLFGWWRGSREVIAGNLLATALLAPAGFLLYGAPGGLVGAALTVLVLLKHLKQARDLLRGAAAAPTSVDNIP